MSNNLTPAQIREQLTADEKLFDMAHPMYYISPVNVTPAFSLRPIIRPANHEGSALKPALHSHFMASGPFSLGKI
jgi:hypothetical protein